MTREEFIRVLEEKGYYYEIEGDKIVVIESEHVDLDSLKTIPSGVEFKNGSDVYLNSLKTIPPGVEFNNGGGVDLESLETLPPGVEFNNGGYVDLESLETISPGVVFRNRWRVRSNSLFGGFLDGWSGNIDGIDSKRLLNLMIKRGLFI